MSGPAASSTDSGTTQAFCFWNKNGKYLGQHNRMTVELRDPSHWYASDADKNNKKIVANFGKWSYQENKDLKFESLISKLRDSSDKSNFATWNYTGDKRFYVDYLLEISEAKPPNFSPSDEKMAHSNWVADTHSSAESLSHSQPEQDNLGARDQPPGDQTLVEGSARTGSPSTESADNGFASKQNSRESVDRDLLEKLLSDFESKSLDSLKSVKAGIKQCQEMVDKVKESVTNASDKLKKIENLADKQARTTEAHFEQARITTWTVVILVVIVLVAAALSNRALLLGTNAPRPIAIKDLQESAEDITKGVDEQVKSSGRDTADKIGKLQKESSDQFREIKDLIRNNRVFPGQGPGQLTDDRAALKEVKGLIVGIHEALKAQGEAESKWGEGSDRERKRLENDLVSKLDRMRDEVAKTIGRVGSESKAASDAVTNRMDVVTKKIDAVSEETRKASDNVEKAIAARLGDIEKESIKKAEELSGRLARLEASLHLPKTEELYSVAIVVDGGQELANYGDRQVRQAVIDAVSQAVRQTEARPIGVIWNRGADPVVIEMLDRHFIENVAEIKSRLSEGLVATPGERSDWSVGLERALGLLALQESPRRRVVQISFAESAETTSPEREAKLAETARKHKIEVWTIELMTPGSTPAKGFVDAALKSGGQFVSVPISERSAQDGAAMSFSGRLRSILLDALSLPESMELPR